MSTVKSVLVYVAQVWAGALDKASLRTRLLWVQRIGALRLCHASHCIRCNCTGDGANIHSSAGKKAAIYARAENSGRQVCRVNERGHTLNLWHQIGKPENRGRLTARLFKDIHPLVKRRHGEVVDLTQLQWGHGYFREYLHRMGNHPTNSWVSVL